MNSQSTLRLIQFRAAYNLPVHVGTECGHFSHHGLKVEVAYTPGSAYLIESLKAGEFQLGHTAADDVVADVEGQTGKSNEDSDLFLFIGLHSGLLRLVSSPECRNFESLRGKSLSVDARTTGFVFILEKALRSKGLGPKDYNLVEVGGVETRYRALLDGRSSGTLLTPPYDGNAVEAGCHLLARGDEIMPVYQATCGAARRVWARENADILVHYIQGYVEATQWCFDPRNRQSCLDLLAKHNGIKGSTAEKTLDALLDPKDGIYPKTKLNLPGITAALELRAEMGFLARPTPPAEKYVDLSYYQKAAGSD